MKQAVLESINIDQDQFYIVIYSVVNGEIASPLQSLPQEDQIQNAKEVIDTYRRNLEDYGEPEVICSDDQVEVDLIEYFHEG